MLYNHQRSYNFFPRIGAPGRISDLAPYAVDAFINQEATGTMKLGCGVVATSGVKDGISLPTSSATAATFVGITVNGGTNEHGIEEMNFIRQYKNIGVMRYGRVFAQVAKVSAPIAVNAPIYLIVDGEDAGCFTNVAGTKTESATGNGYTTIAIKGRFLTDVDATCNIAEIELFNQAQA